MIDTYRIELSAADLVVIRRALGRAPHDQARSIIDSISAQIDAIELQRAAPRTSTEAALLRAAPDTPDAEG